MKNSRENMTIIFIIILSIIVTSCKKNEPILSTGTSSKALDNQIKVKDGMLQFSSFQAFHNAINFFNSMSPEERIQWGQSNGIKTQQMIIDELGMAQTLFENVKYAGIDENITIEEMKQIGLKPEWCPEILEYESSGLLTTKVEEDGSISFEPNNRKFFTTSVLNEQGFVLVEDRIYLYKDKMIKFTKYDSEESAQKLLNINNSESDESVQIANFSNTEVLKLNEREREIGSIFDQNYNGKIWYNVTKKKRFNHYVRMYSYEYNSNYGSPPPFYPITRRLYNLFVTHSWAEQKRLGSWNIRSTYKPIKYIGGSWDWKINPLNTQPPFTSGYIAGGLKTSPFSEHTTTNDKCIIMSPTGVFNNMFNGDFVEYLNLSIKGIFSGGSSGYNTHYHKTVVSGIPK